MRESKVEQELILRVLELDGEVRKLKFIGHNGAPDRLVMLPAFITKGPAGTIPAERFLVELKAPGKGLEPHQEREHARLRKFGWRVEVVDSLERVKEILG